ncbi:hypothetical protein BDV96DRAFT_503211 [Lophiotrema nucula]|uniref:GTP cyclohydrolase 1 type 2/Nif3 n=1 Tax=Lophiotrema nucula TaxID=690887 RepID=A0A6A5YPZ9_9PLEO|nr:hypothetical protein BDV96DRAFT_503211 [Lophiotrema nucula]
MTQKRPTHAAVTGHVSTLLPPKTNDVSRIYHVPRHPHYDPIRSLADKIILSVTPTSGVYKEIGYLEAHEPQSVINGAPSARSPPRVACFLHRPFTLDRRRVRKGTLVLSSHTSFDEVLTVGWNTAFAAGLGMNVAESICIQGYKGDSERKIGIVGRVSMQQTALLRHIQQEFGTIEYIKESVSEDLRVVAIMNAFRAEEVERVFEAAQQQGWISPERGGIDMLYLTGQPRESGLAAATALGIAVACVGHRAAEEWGIRYMAASLRSAFPRVEVKEIYEEEEVSLQRRRKEPGTAPVTNNTTDPNYQ